MTFVRAPATPRELFGSIHCLDIQRPQARCKQTTCAWKRSSSHLYLDTRPSWGIGTVRSTDDEKAKRRLRPAPWSVFHWATPVLRELSRCAGRPLPGGPAPVRPYPCSPPRAAQQLTAFPPHSERATGPVCRGGSGNRAALRRPVAAPARRPLHQRLSPPVRVFCVRDTAW